MLKKPHGTNIRRWTPNRFVDLQKGRRHSIWSYTVILGIVGVQISAFSNPSSARPLIPECLSKYVTNRNLTTFFLGSQRGYSAIARPPARGSVLCSRWWACSSTGILVLESKSSSQESRQTVATSAGVNLRHPKTLKSSWQKLSRHGQFHSGKPMLQTSKRRLLLRSGIDSHSQATCIWSRWDLRQSLGSWNKVKRLRIMSNGGNLSRNSSEWASNTRKFVSSSWRCSAVMANINPAKHPTISLVRR